MIFLRWKTFAATLVACALIASMPIAVGSQNTSGTPQTKDAPVAEEPKGPQPIPASQISVKSEETSEVLRSLRDRPEPDPDIQQILEAIPAAMGELQDLLGETELRLKGTVSARALEDLDRRWSRHKQRILGWLSTVNKRAQALDRDLETLQQLRATWEVTEQSAGEAGLQDAQVEVVRGAVSSVVEMENLFGDRRSEILTVQEQVDKAAEVVRNALDGIDAARDRTRLQLFHLDSRPLWEVIADPPPRVEHWEHIVAAWNDSKRDLRDFVDAYRDELIVHGIGLLLLVLILFLIKRRARAIDLEGPDLTASARVISRPVSTGITLWLLATLLLFDDAPRLIDELASLVLFVPLFRILPARVVKRIPGLLAVLVALNLFGRFVDILAYMSPLYRLALLLESILCLTAVSVSLRQTRPAPGEPPSNWRALIRFVQWTAILLLIVAIITNVVGNVSYAGTVTRATYLSAYLALALYAVYFVATGLIHIALRTRFFRGLKMVRRHDQLIIDRILTVLRLGLLVFWAVTTLNQMQVFDPAKEAIAKVLTAEAKFGSVGLSLGGVLSFAVTVWASFMISRLLRFILEEDVFPRLTLPRGVPSAITIGLHYSVLLLGFFLAIAATGADLGKTTILAGAFGVGIGFGLQNIVNNFISGLILIVERPILPGDSVQIDTLYGEVKRIGLRSSTVRTWEGAEVIVPNGNLISSQVINWTLSDRQRRLDVHVGVEYGNDPEEVVRVLVAAAANVPSLMEHPEPTVLFLGFGDYSLDFQLRVWTAETSFLKQKSELTIAVNRALNDAGMVIPFPKRDIRVTAAEPGAPDNIPDKETRDEA